MPNYNGLFLLPTQFDTMTEQYIAFWFRRDLRLFDNTGLHHALQQGYKVLPVFIFDTDILDKLEDKDDVRVTFIHQEITALHAALQEKGSGLVIKYATPMAAWQAIVEEYPIHAVYTNRDYEPYAKSRDAAVGDWLKERGIGFKTFKDQVFLEGHEVLTGKGTPYHVFSPYARKWRSELPNDAFTPLPNALDSDQWATPNSHAIPSLSDMGFVPSSIAIPGKVVDDTILSNYHEQRNLPAVKGTSRLSHHLRFGTISLRDLAARAARLNDTYLNELIWREFYMMILDHYPRVVDTSFTQKYDQIAWNRSTEDFERWCAGETGVPIVDAGMRELNTTAYMHNRVRMIVASFLTKNLLIDWRWGEAYFARKLLDFELSSNNGGWQWAASTGTDAAPYFRVFNPISQQKKFDPQLVYTKRWVPELLTDRYPKAPMVDVKASRQRAIDAFRAVG